MTDNENIDNEDALMRPKLNLPPIEATTSPQLVKSPFMQLKLLEISSKDLENPNLHYEIVSTGKRGVCLLFNHHVFDKNTGQSRRDGTNLDADSMEKIFSTLRYEVIRYTDATTEQYVKAIDQVQRMDHSTFDSFVCIILTHGDNGIIFTHDSYLNVDYIVAKFRGDFCPNLIGKPKLFFIQACRGANFDKGAKKLEHDGESETISYKSPVEADVLIANSTFPGYFAWRNCQQGSWFIQELFKVLRNDLQMKTPHDIVTLLAMVARKVAVLYESNTGQIESHGMKQMTFFTSTLTKLCYLTGTPSK